MAIEVFQAGLETIAKRRNDKPVNLRLWLAVRCQEEDDRTMRHLYQLGHQAKISNSEEQMDLFVSFCRELNLDPTHVLEDIETNRAPLPISIESSGISVQACAEFFLRNMIPGQQYAVRTIKARAKNNGYTPYAINQAKSQLGIYSKRSGSKWVWILPGAPLKTEQSESVAPFECVTDDEVDDHKILSEAEMGGT